LQALWWVCCMINTLTTVLTAYHPLSKTTIRNKQCWKPCALIQAQSTLLTMGVKMPETCWDTTDWINHYLLNLVGLTFDYLSKMQGQTNLKENSWWLILWPQKSIWQCRTYFIVKIRI
jgi:hypothetical protein